MVNRRPTQRELIERVEWLINLRWIAIIAIGVIGFFVKYNLNLPLPLLTLYTIALLIALYNTFFGRYVHRLKMGRISANWPQIVNRFVNLQISLDFVALTSIIHFSGGVENPFIFYSIFHIIIASTLLSTRASYLQATWFIFLFGVMANLEYLGIFPHIGLLAQGLYRNEAYVLGVFFVLATTLYFSVYITTYITSKVREREGELITLGETLEKRTRELLELNRRLREQDRLKSEYVQMVSHDLQAPLAAIQSLLRVILEGLTGEINEKTREILERAEKRTFALLHLVRDLLDLSRIRAAKTLNLQVFSLLDIVKKSIEDMRIKAENKSITLKLEIPEFLSLMRADPEHLERVFVNLLTNAVKYTPPGGRVRVKVEEEADHVRVDISDTGIGIPAQELPYVFNEFYRASNAKLYEPEGTGLGLSLVKHIIERHGGRIWIESKEGKGSTFSFVIPKYTRAR